MHYNADNTDGYTQAELDALNAELEARLTGIERHTDEWYRVIKEHTDEMSKR